MAIEILKPSVVQGFRDTLKTSSVPQFIETTNPPTPTITVNNYAEVKPKNAPRFCFYFSIAAATTAEHITIGSGSGFVFIIEGMSISVVPGAASHTVYGDIYGAVSSQSLGFFSAEVPANTPLNQTTIFSGGIKMLPGETITLYKENVASSLIDAYFWGYKRPYEPEIDNVAIQVNTSAP